MQAKKTLLAIALGTATLGASAYETEYGNAYADVKVRYETNDTDDATDNDAATGLITDAAVGFETLNYEGFSALVEYEIVQPLIDDYAPEKAGYDAIADPETREWNRAQVSYKKDEFGAIVGRQRIILDGARFVGNVGWRANEQTFDAVTLTYSKDELSLHYSFIDQVNGILPRFDADTTSHLLNAGYKVGTGKITAYAYLLEDDDTENSQRDTFGLSYNGSYDMDGTKLIYKAEYATQSTETADTNYFALEGGAVVSGVTLALGNETLGSDDGNAAFETPLATKHKFNGWADKFLSTTVSTSGDGLSDTYVKAAGAVAGVKLVGFYHTFNSVEDDVDFGNELDLLAVKKLDDTFTIGAKAAFYSAGDTGADTTKMWAWVQAKF